MIRRTYCLHYRILNEVIAVVVAVDTAWLLSDFILWMRL
jgi:hypothetical protein